MSTTPQPGRAKAAALYEAARESCQGNPSPLRLACLDISRALRSAAGRAVMAT